MASAASVLLSEHFSACTSPGSAGASIGRHCVVSRHGGLQVVSAAVGGVFACSVLQRHGLTAREGEFPCTGVFWQLGDAARLAVALLVHVALREASPLRFWLRAEGLSSTTACGGASGGACSECARSACATCSGTCSGSGGASGPCACSTSATTSNPTAPATSLACFTLRETAELEGTSLDATPLRAFFATLKPHLAALPALLFGASNAASTTTRGFDASLLVSFCAFAKCLDFVSKHAVRVVAPQHEKKPWHVVAASAGNWPAAFAAQWRRRLGPNAFELMGPRGGALALEDDHEDSHANDTPNASGAGLLVWEEIFGRILTPTLSSSWQRDPNSTTSTVLSERDETTLNARNAWYKQPPQNSNSTGSFLVLLPFFSQIDRKSRPYDQDYREDELRFLNLRLQQQQHQLHPTTATSPTSNFFIPTRTDVRVEYHPPASYLVPIVSTDHDGIRYDHANAIRLENEDDNDLSDDLAASGGMQDPELLLASRIVVPPGFAVKHQPAHFNVFHVTNVYPRQRLTMSNGNLSNHHLLLCHGTIEERNPYDIIDFPIDLLEDAITYHLEHFGPTTRPLITHTNPNTSSGAAPSPFHTDADLSKRHVTASERDAARRGKGKQIARYDVVTYERARGLLKAMGVFPNEGGVIRCKSEYFWQEEAFSTIIQVLLMSSDQLTEYTHEPCFLDYNCMLFSNTPPTPTSPTSPLSTESPTTPLLPKEFPAPRSNMIPSHRIRNRGAMPARPGCLDAFFAVTRSVLERRLRMYPTTLAEDQELLGRMSESYRRWCEGRDAVLAASVAASGVVNGGGKDGEGVVERVGVNGVSVGGGGHEEKRRRMEGDESGGTTKRGSVTPPSPVGGGGGLAVEEEKVRSVSRGASLEPRTEGLERMKKSNSTIASEGAATDVTLEGAEPTQKPIIASTLPVFNFTAPNTYTVAAQPSPILPSPPSAPSPPPQQQPTEPATTEWITNNRFMAVKFRMSEKRNLYSALQFLDSMIAKRSSSSDKNAPTVLVANAPATRQAVAAGVPNAAAVQIELMRQQLALLRQQGLMDDEDGDEMEDEEYDYSELGSDEYSDMMSENGR
ncbi:hypothetical protein HDU98_002946 [Podochytrium sp. JEL0797]|nr:hypothetical protein HDU98_002946 [Podochytrium sp. JEL0797]